MSALFDGAVVFPSGEKGRLWVDVPLENDRVDTDGQKVDEG